MSSRESRTIIYGRSNKPVIRFRFKAVPIFFIIPIIVCFIIYMAGVNIGIGSGKSKKINKIQSLIADSKIESSVDEMPVSKNNDIVNPVPESDPVSETYLGKCMFVGDSITVGFADYQFVSMKNICATVGMNIEKINTDKMKTTYGELTALDTLKEAKPANIYIMLGSNGIAWMTNEEMLSLYSDFVDNIKKALPDSDVYILSIPPVTAEREASKKDPIKNEAIDQYNSELLKMADSKGIYYVDINTVLKGSDGKFPAADAADDGMHFKKNTYKTVVDYILSHTAA